MRRLFLLLMFLSWQFLEGQVPSFEPCNANIYASDLRVKEFYDLLFCYEGDEIDYSFPPNSEYNPDASNYEGNLYLLPNQPSGTDYTRAFGCVENGARLIESLCIMYLRTKDQAYIHRAIDISVHWIRALKPITRDGQSYFYWQEQLNFDAENYTPHNPSLMLWAISHLCHIILVDDAGVLCSNEFDFTLLNQYTYVNGALPFSNSINTYGLLADWLISKMVPAMDFLINIAWLGPNTGFRDKGSNNVGALNQQSSFGAALLYLGNLSTKSICFSANGNYYSGLASYLDYARHLAVLFNQSFKVCRNSLCSDCEPDELGVFINVPEEDNYNCFYWFADGWILIGDEKNCLFSPDKFHDYDDFFNYGENPNDDGERFYEDISHGIRSMYFPIVAEKLGFSPLNDFLQQIANTFRKQIVKSFANDEIKLFPNVRGQGYEWCTKKTANCDPEPCALGDQVLEWDGLTWASLHPYDGAGNKFVYYKTKELLKKKLTLASPGSWINGGRLHGLSHVLDAEWANDCPDVILYNRRLVYDQNFEYSRNLTISPRENNCFHGTGMRSFAYPIIDDDVFEITSGVSSKIRAEKSITLKPGVHFARGSSVEIRADLTLSCASARFATDSEAEPQKVNEPINTDIKVPTDSANLNHEILKVSLWPNPFNESINFIVEGYHEPKLIVKDVAGKLIFQRSFSFSEERRNQGSISTATLSNGIYFITILDRGGLEKNFKFVKIE